MALIKRSIHWHITFRPFRGVQVSVATDETNKTSARQIEKELMYACRHKDYTSLSYEARLVLVRMFLNRKWEIPEDLVLPEHGILLEPVKQPDDVLTLWKARIYSENTLILKTPNHGNAIECV